MNTEPPVKKKKIKAAKQKHLALLLKDKNELREALNRGASLKARINAVTAAMNEQRVTVEAQFQGIIDELSEERDQVESGIAIFCQTCRDEVFGEKKTATVGGHEVVFRDNGGAVSTVKGVTQEMALNRLLECDGEMEPMADQFVTVTFKLNKEAIKSQFEGFESFLRACGIVIEHKESFSINYNAVEHESATSTPAVGAVA